MNENDKNHLVHISKLLKTLGTNTGKMLLFSVDELDEPLTPPNCTLKELCVDGSVRDLYTSNIYEFLRTLELLAYLTAK